jgi:multicomponent Na+:H+ antiporter subunit D
MVIAGAGEAHHEIAMLLLLLASIGTFLHTGLKLPYWTWFGKDQGVKAEKAPVNMVIGMAVVATLCTLFGVAPGLLYRHLPWPVHFEPYTVPHLVETAQILIFTFVAFWLLRAKLAGEAKVALDTDWFFRRPAPFVRRVLVDGTNGFFTWTQRVGGRIVDVAARVSRDPAPTLQRLMTTAGNRETDQKSYDPARARPVMMTVVGLVLLVFVALSLMVLLIR